MKLLGSDVSAAFTNVCWTQKFPWLVRTMNEQVSIVWCLYMGPEHMHHSQIITECRDVHIRTVLPVAEYCFWFKSHTGWEAASRPGSPWAGVHSWGMCLGTCRAHCLGPEQEVSCTHSRGLTGEVLHSVITSSKKMCLLLRYTLSNLHGNDKVVNCRTFYHCYANCSQYLRNKFWCHNMILYHNWMCLFIRRRILSEITTGRPIIGIPINLVLSTN